MVRSAQKFPILFKEKIMKKLCLIGVTVVLASCASTPANIASFQPYRLIDKNIQVGTPKSYSLGQSVVHLSERYTNPDYPNEGTLNTLFNTKLHEKLSTQGVSSEHGYQLDLDIQYKRIYAGEAFGAHSHFGSSSCRYESKIIQNHQLIAQYDADPIADNNINNNQRNLFANLGKLGTMMTNSGSSKDEENDIDRCVDAIVRDLPR